MNGESQGPPGAPTVPVTIVTGLLGSGKTTLLKRLLRDSGGLRVLLVQNEFAQEMGIEAPALVDATQQQQQQQQQQPSSVILTSGEDGGLSGAPGGPSLPYSNLVELPGGCLCCSVRGELAQALESLLAAYGERVDAVLIETNGAADPQPIAEALWTDEQLMAKLCLDGVVCLIDASRPHAVLAADPAAAADVGEGALPGAPKGPLSLEGHGGLGIAAMKQLACADSLLLTKGDICMEQQLLRLRQKLTRINPGAPIYRCIKGEAPLHAVLGLRAYSNGRCSSSLAGRGPTPEAAAATAAAQALWQQQQQQEEQQQQQNEHECLSGRGCCHKTLGGLGSVMLSFALGGPDGAPQLFSLRRLQQAVGELLWEEETAEASERAPEIHAAIFRCKGLFPAWRDYPDEAEGDTGKCNTLLPACSCRSNRRHSLLQQQLSLKQR